MANIFITSSNCRIMSEMYGTYTLHAATVLSCKSSDFLFSSTEFSAYRIQTHRTSERETVVGETNHGRILYSASPRSMTSAGPAIFFTLGILSSFSSCTVLASCSPCSKLLRNSGSNSSFWHETPMSWIEVRVYPSCLEIQLEV